MYLVALTVAPLGADRGRFGDFAVHQSDLWARHLTVVTDQRFSALFEREREYRVVETIDPIAPSPSELLRSEVTISRPAESVNISMAPTGGGTLYYLIDARGNFYCSTRISLLRDAGVAIRENRAVIPELFSYAYVTPPNTMYADVKRLLLGSRVSFGFKSGKPEIVSEIIYLGKTTASRGSASTPEAAAEATLQALADEVRKLRPLKGQVAVPLSGGTDSSILWALCNRGLGIRDSYSTGYSFEDPQRNREKEYALSAAKAFGAQHHFFETTTKDYLRAVVECIHVSEEPIHMQAALFQRQYAAGMPPETRVLVSGQGADGINGFRLQAKLHAARQKISTRWVAGKPDVALGLARALRSAGIRSRQLDVATGEHLALADPDNTIWMHEKYGNESWAQEYFGTTREQTIQGRHELVKMFGEHDIYDRLALLYVYSDIAVAGAMWSKIAESHGRGILYPFTAFPVMDAALSIPWDVKLSELKKILREVARLLRVPEFIMSRPKSGLGIDPDRWAVKDGALEPLIPLVKGVFDIDVIRRLQKKPNRCNATTFWCILNYAIWRRLFIDGEPIETLLCEIESS
jgi:asparagine synthase (glutamine-hydrolysing)